MSKRSSLRDNSSKRRRSSARDGKRRCPSAHAKVCSAHRLLNETLPYTCPNSKTCQSTLLCSSCKKILKTKRPSQMCETAYCRITKDSGIKRSIKNRLFCNEPTCPYSKCYTDDPKKCTDTKKKQQKSKERPGQKVNSNGASGTVPKQKNLKQTPTPVAKKSIQKKRAFNAGSVENIQKTSEVNNIEQNFVKVKSQLLITQSKILSQEAKEAIVGDDTTIASSLYESFTLESKQLDVAVNNTPIEIVNLMPQNKINVSKSVSKNTRIENISKDIHSENITKGIHNSSTRPEWIKPKDTDEHETHTPSGSCELCSGDSATSAEADSESISKEQISEEASAGQLISITKQLDKGEQTSISSTNVKANQGSISRTPREAAGEQLISTTKQLDKGEKTSISSTNVEADQGSISKEAISEEASDGQLISITKQHDKGEQTSICFTIVKADHQSISNDQISEEVSAGSTATSVEANEQSVSKEQISRGEASGQLTSVTKQLHKKGQTSISSTNVKADQRSISKEQISEETVDAQLISIAKQLDKGEQTSICFTSTKADQQNILKEQTSREAAGGQLTSITKQLDKGEQTSFCCTCMKADQQCTSKEQTCREAADEQLTCITKQLDKEEQTSICLNELAPVNDIDTEHEISSNRLNQLMSFTNQHCNCFYDTEHKLIDTSSQTPNANSQSELKKTILVDLSCFILEKSDSGAFTDKHKNLNNRDPIPSYVEDCCSESTSWNSYQFIAGNILSNINNPDCASISDNESDVVKGSLTTDIANEVQSLVTSSIVKRSIHEIEAALQNPNRPMKESIHKKKDIGKTDTNLGILVSTGEVERTSSFDSSKDLQENLENTPDKQNSKEASIPLDFNTTKDKDTAINEKDIWNGSTEPIDLTSRSSASVSKPSDAEQLIEKNDDDAQKDLQDILDSTSDKSKTTAPKISEDKHPAPKSKNTRQRRTESIMNIKRQPILSKSPVSKSSINKTSIVKNDTGMTSVQNKELQNKNISSVFLDEQSTGENNVENRIATDVSSQRSSTNPKTSEAKQSIDKNEGINQNITNKTGEIESETKRQNNIEILESTAVKLSFTETPGNRIATTSKSSIRKRSTETGRQSSTKTKTLPSKDQKDSRQSAAAKRSSTNVSVKRSSTPLKTIEIRSSTDKNKPIRHSRTNAETNLKSGQQSQTKVHPVNRRSRDKSNKRASASPKRSITKHSTDATKIVKDDTEDPTFQPLLLPSRTPAQTPLKMSCSNVICDNRPVLPFSCPYCSHDNGLNENQIKGKAKCPYCNQYYSIKKTEHVHGGSGQPSSTKFNKSPITLHVADSDMFFDASDSDFGLGRSQCGPSSASTLPFAASETQSGYSKDANSIGTRCSEVKDFDKTSLQYEPFPILIPSSKDCENCRKGLKSTKSPAKCDTDSNDIFFDAQPCSDKNPKPLKRQHEKVDAKSTIKSHCTEKVENSLDSKSAQPLNRIKECRCTVKKTAISLPDCRQHYDKENYNDLEDHKKVRVKEQDDQKCDEIQTTEQQSQPCAEPNLNKTEPERWEKYSIQNITNCSKCLGNTAGLNFTTVYHCSTSIGMAEVSIRFPIAEHSLDGSANIASAASTSDLCDLSVIRNILQNVKSMQCNKKEAKEEESKSAKGKDDDGHCDKENIGINKPEILSCCSKKNSEQTINNMKSSSNSKCSTCILGKIPSCDGKLKVLGEDEIASISTIQLTKAIDAECKRNELESKSFYTDALSMRSFYDIQSSKSMEFDSKMNFKDVKSDASFAWTRK